MSTQQHRRVERLLRVGTSLALGGGAAYWLWLQEAALGAWLASLATLLVAAWLSRSALRRQQAIAVGLQTLTLAAVLLGLHQSLPIGEGSLTRLGDGTALRAVLCGSVFISLYALTLTGRHCLGGRLAFDRLWIGAAPVARWLVGALLLAAMAAFSAEFFFLGDGARFDYRVARNHPLFAFRMPGTYMYAHAKERRVADVHHYDFRQSKPTDVVRIVLNGASTMAGFGLEPDYRPAEVLRSVLARGIAGKRVEVILLGVSGKYQVNELIDTVVTLPHWSPDLVISFNGYNEINWGETPEHYEGMPYTENEIGQALNVPPELGALFSRTHLGAGLWKRKWLAPWPSRTVLRDPLEYEPPRYFDYLRLTARNLADLRVPYVYAFCPNVFAWKHRVGEAASTPEVLRSFQAKASVARQDAHLEQADAARRPEAAQIVTAEGQIYYPVMDLLERFPDVDDVFRDDCHLTQRAVRLVMADLAGKIPGWLSTWQPPPRAPQDPSTADGAPRASPP